MSAEIAIVDRGRGPQLSTSRITVQDLVPYLQDRFTHEQIIEIMPVLTVEEIRVIERYIQDNFNAVMEQDRRIRERIEARRKPPEVEEAEHQERLIRLANFRQKIQQEKQKLNGDRAASG
ncbi:MAG TPA: hypothetical protein VGP68_05920 [Gemmataceae bacterium]|nr:hypothetical protein [Gemmataceae bacterium]